MPFNQFSHLEKQQAKEAFCAGQCGHRQMITMNLTNWTKTQRLLTDGEKTKHVGCSKQNPYMALLVIAA